MTCDLHILPNLKCLYIRPRGTSWFSAVLDVVAGVVIRETLIAIWSHLGSRHCKLQRWLQFCPLDTETNFILHSSFKIPAALLGKHLALLWLSLVCIFYFSLHVHMQLCASVIINQKLKKKEVVMLFWIYLLLGLCEISKFIWKSFRCLFGFFPTVYKCTSNNQCKVYFRSDWPFHFDL